MGSFLVFRQVFFDGRTHDARRTHMPGKSCSLQTGNDDEPLTQVSRQPERVSGVVFHDCLDEKKYTEWRRTREFWIESIELGSQSDRLAGESVTRWIGQDFAPEVLTDCKRVVYSGYAVAVVALNHQRRQ
jgi:hypothetical protein